MGTQLPPPAERGTAASPTPFSVHFALSGTVVHFSTWWALVNYLVQTCYLLDEIYFLPICKTYILLLVRKTTNTFQLCPKWEVLCAGHQLLITLSVQELFLWAPMATLYMYMCNKHSTKVVDSYQLFSRRCLNAIFSSSIRCFPVVSIII